MLTALKKTFTTWLFQQQIQQMDSHWSEYIEATSTVEAYQKIIQTMFADGVVNQGRLTVLDAFTTDVCQKYPTIAADIRSYQLSTLNQLQHNH